MLGFVALEMKAGGFLETGVDLENPDFAAMARAIGIHASIVWSRRAGRDGCPAGSAARAAISSAARSVVARSVVDC